MPVIKSITNPSIRYQLKWNDDAFRYHMALPNASKYSTYGDGNTQHEPDRPVDDLASVVDLIKSCHEALKSAIRENDQSLIDAIKSAVHSRPAVTFDDAMRAQKLIISGKKCYLVNNELVSGAKYVNRRDAEPVDGWLNDESSHEDCSSFRQKLIAGKYPSMLDLLSSSYLADTGIYYFQLKRLGNENAISAMELSESNRLLNHIMTVIDAFNTVSWFTK